MRLSVTTTRKSETGINFLNHASHNYISSRILYDYSQIFDAGVLAHEAIEKVIKALMYLEDDKKQVRGHLLSKLSDKLYNDYGYSLEDFKEVLVYYDDCYKFRYPDNKHPTSFGSGGSDVITLDKLFYYIHDLCMGKVDKKMKYKSGVYYHCVDYFELGYEDIIESLSKNNKSFTKEMIDEAREYWHSRGYYKKNENGSMKTPFGVTIVNRNLSHPKN